MNIYKRLAEGGGYNLPYLLHIYNNTMHVYVVNNVDDISYNGHVYKASTFDYIPSDDGSASLNIELVEANNIINILEGSSINVESVGILYDGTVTKIQEFKHQFAEANWTGESLSLKLKQDDRLDMTFPALIFNTYNNRG